jgi:hypothetical protein
MTDILKAGFRLSSSTVARVLMSRVYSPLISITSFQGTVRPERHTFPMVSGTVEESAGKCYILLIPAMDSEGRIPFELVDSSKSFDVSGVFALNLDNLIPVTVRPERHTFPMVSGTVEESAGKCYILLIPAMDFLDNLIPVTKVSQRPAITQVRKSIAGIRRI